MGSLSSPRYIRSWLYFPKSDVVSVCCAIKSNYSYTENQSLFEFVKLRDSNHGYYNIRNIIRVKYRQMT